MDLAYVPVSLVIFGKSVPWPQVLIYVALKKTFFFLNSDVYCHLYCHLSLLLESFWYSTMEAPVIGHPGATTENQSGVMDATWGNRRISFVAIYPFLAFNFRRFGMVVAYKMMKHKRYFSLATYLSARKSYMQTTSRPRGRHLVSLKTQSLRIPRPTFQLGLKFECDYMKYFNPGWNSLDTINRNLLFKEDCFRKPKWNLSPGWNPPGSRPLS